MSFGELSTIICSLLTLCDFTDIGKVKRYTKKKKDALQGILRNLTEWRVHSLAL